MVTREDRFLQGNWRAGWALNLHTRSSRPRADGGWDTEYTDEGGWLNRLKYRGDQTAIDPIVDRAAAFLRTRVVLPAISVIIPVPPSDTSRPAQPVEQLAIRIGAAVGIPVALDYMIKLKPTQPLKSIDDPMLRREQLFQAFGVKDRSLAGRVVLLFDDLYRSGETLRAITRALHDEGRVAGVYVLTITKTRSLR